MALTSLFLLREEKGKDKNNIKELIRTEEYKTVNRRDGKKKTTNNQQPPEDWFVGACGHTCVGNLIVALYDHIPPQWEHLD